MGLGGAGGGACKGVGRGDKCGCWLSCRDCLEWDLVLFLWSKTVVSNFGLGVRVGSHLELEWAVRLYIVIWSMEVKGDLQ